MSYDEMDGGNSGRGMDYLSSFEMTAMTHMGAVKCTMHESIGRAGHPCRCDVNAWSHGLLEFETRAPV